MILLYLHVMQQLIEGSTLMKKKINFFLLLHNNTKVQQWPHYFIYLIYSVLTVTVNKYNKHFMVIISSYFNSQVANHYSQYTMGYMKNKCKLRYSKSSSAVTHNKHLFHRFSNTLCALRPLILTILIYRGETQRNRRCQQVE